MDRKHTGSEPAAGAVGGTPLSSGRRASDAPAEDGRYPRDTTAGQSGFTDPGATPRTPSAASGLTDPALAEDLGAEFAFRGDQMEGELEAARREAAAHLDTAQRLQADFDNYRRRVARDAEDAAKRAGQRVISEMLPALDNLERALAHAPEGGEGTAFADGVAMVLQQLLDVFAKEGVERIDPIGQPFDPNEHQAVGQAERRDVAEGTVVEVYQRGYRMHGRVLRPAAVVVSTGGPES